MDLFDQTGFRTGIALGVLVAVVTLVAGWIRRETAPRRELPMGGGLAAAALGAVAFQRSVPVLVVLCVAAIAAVHALGRVRPVNVWSASALTAPFAWALALRGDVIDVGWFRVLAAAAIITLAPLLGAFDADDTDRLTPALFALTTLGIAFAVPDTEEAAALLGVVLPLALLGWPLGRCGLGRAGAAAAVAVALWVAAVDSRGRPSALIGAVACFALPVAITVVRGLWPEARIPRRRRWYDAPACVSVHGMFVAVASRVAGTSSSVARAAGVASLLGVAALVAAVLFVALRPRDEPGSRTGRSGQHRSRSRGRMRSGSPPRPAGSRHL